MTFYRYKCRGPYAFDAAELSRLQAGLTLNQHHPWPVDRVMVDDPKHRDLPLWQRPRAKALNRLLRAGDELYIALGEFSGCASDIAAFYRRTAQILRGWDARGVRLRISELPPEIDDQAGVIAMLESIASAEETWALEAACEV